MAYDARARIAIVYPGDYAARASATPEDNRFTHLFRAFAVERMHAEPAVYRDDFCAEVHDQLMRVDGVLVWVNHQNGYSQMESWYLQNLAIRKSQIFWT